MKKILLASGCSFTFEKWNWPGVLCKEFNLDLFNVGMASQGNGLISRKIIPALDEILKSYDKDDILVGVMWSGVNKHEYHSNNTSDIKTWGYFKPTDIVENPTSVVKNNYNWRILNPGWDSEEIRLFYVKYQNNISSMVFTIEHILRIQWYLDMLGIDYFMTTYMDIFNWGNLCYHPEIENLYSKIDFTKFLPIDGCFEWVKENYLENGLPGIDKYGNLGQHPTEYGHKMFSKKVIIPHLIKNKIIN